MSLLSPTCRLTCIRLWLKRLERTTSLSLTRSAISPAPDYPEEWWYRITTTNRGTGLSAMGTLPRYRARLSYSISLKSWTLQLQHVMPFLTSVAKCGIATHIIFSTPSMLLLWIWTFFRWNGIPSLGTRIYDWISIRIAMYFLYSIHNTFIIP